MLIAGEPAEPGLRQEDGGPGAPGDNSAARLGEDGSAEQMLRLQQQVAQLHEAFRSQESRWAAAQRQLQSQIDALVRQNLELRAGLTTPGPLREADAAAPGTGRKLDACLDGQATRAFSRSPQEPSGRKSPEPAAEVARLQEDRPAAGGNDAHSQPCEGPEGRLPSPEQTDGSARCPPGTAGPQNPPGERGPSRMDAQTEEGDKEEGTRPPAGEVAQALGDGWESITSQKGTGKDRGAGKKTTVLRFLNGDVKKVLPDQRVVSRLADARIRRTPHPSGLDVVRFPNQQTEKYHPDGSKEIVGPDGTMRRLSGGREETVFPDGTVVTVERNGDRTIVFSNGQREIQTAQFKRREYPDGTVKTVYCTGYRETRSASGTVKVRPPRN